ncbi:pilin [Dactylosporangium salmoneum]|uniref:TrbC/VIRB2 family protein n=1 Tax=Dactylosporangium salmoneum TaxID=53361 RepID=A0ABN3GEP1_9ACTN
MLRRNISRLVLVLTATASAVAVAVPAYAAPAPDAPGAHDLPTIISNITAWVAGLLIGVATLFLTIGGLRYLAAGGDPSEVDKAKSAVKSALMGYALAVLAPILLAVVKGWIGG